MPDRDALPPAADALPRVTLAAGGATAAVFEHGAHAASYVPAGGGEVLFVSREAIFAPGTSIRGGIPVVFPQFADQGPLPKHGLVRAVPWTVARRSAGEAVLALRDDAAMRAHWPHAFRAALAVALGAEGLRVALTVENAGESPFAFTAALHTYLRVADVRRVAIHGLDGVRYRDKVRGGEHVQPAGPLRIDGEVDRPYLGAPDEVRVEDAEGARTLVVRKEGFPDCVVWNPGAENARALPDLADDEHLAFVCVEAARVETPLSLAPGERWTGAQFLAVR